MRIHFRASRASNGIPFGVFGLMGAKTGENARIVTSVWHRLGVLVTMISKVFRSTSIFPLLFVAFAVLAISAQTSPTQYQSQEVSEIDGIPVLIKHLPEWESVRGSTKFATKAEDFKTALGERPVLDVIEFIPGTEAVTAPYPAGKLVIVEFASPQLSVETDNKVKQLLADSGDTATAYRRIGNYNAFVFDVTDLSAAEALLDRVKYEKQAQWLGRNPFLITAERAFVLTTSDIFLSTAMVIVFGMGGAVLVGIFVGYIFFYFRDGKRSKMRTFSDAGGMTRLNLDGYTPEIGSDRLLGK